MVSPYLLRRPRSLDEAAAERATQSPPPIDEAARKAVLEAIGRFRLPQPAPQERTAPMRPQRAAGGKARRR
jgi:hypothetical protein